MSEEVKHHRISMSQWSTLAVCPHFVPTKKSSPEADQGTEAHRETAAIYAKIQDGEPETAFDHPCKYEQAAWCAARYRMLQKLRDVPEEQRESLSAACAVEMKLTIMQTDPLIDGIYGYADFVRLLRDRESGKLMEVAVADFKTFSDGTRNYDEQLAGYAVAVASTIPEAGDDVAVKLYTEHGVARRETVSVCTLGDCRRIAVDTVMKYLCRDRFPKVLNPKCKYCSHYPCEGAIQMLKAVQPELARLQLTETAMDAAPLSVPLTLAALEDVQRLIDQARATAAKCIKKHGIPYVTDGLPRWKLGTDYCMYEVRTSLGTRKIPDLPKVFDMLIDGSRIDLRTLLGICSMPVGKLETLLKTQLKLKPQEAKKLIDDLNIVERGANTEVLKRIA